MGRKHTVARMPASLVMIASSTASAQTITGGYELRSTNVVSPAQPTTTVEVWSWWDHTPAQLQIFAAGNLDLVAESGEFSDGTYVISPGSTGGGPYIIVGSRISGIAKGQLHLPTLGIYGDPANPILLFTAKWTTTDFSQVRTVDLWTENTNNFVLSDWITGATTQLYPGGFITGAGVIQVIPAPPVMWTVLVLALCGTSRRRGCN